MTLQPELKDGSIPVATVSRIASDTETEIIRRLMMEGQNKDQEIENLKCQKEVLEKDNKDMHDKVDFFLLFTVFRV